MKMWLKAFVHNVVVHPLMMFVPCDIAHTMHDRNANWAFGLNRYDELKLEKNVNNELISDIDYSFEEIEKSIIEKRDEVNYFLNKKSNNLLKSSAMDTIYLAQAEHALDTLLTLKQDISKKYKNNN